MVARPKGPNDVDSTISLPGLAQANEIKHRPGVPNIVSDMSDTYISGKTTGQTANTSSYNTNIPSTISLPGVAQANEIEHQPWGGTKHQNYGIKYDESVGKIREEVNMPKTVTTRLRKTAGNKTAGKKTPSSTTVFIPEGATRPRGDKPRNRIVRTKKKCKGLNCNLMGGNRKSKKRTRRKGRTGRGRRRTGRGRRRTGRHKRRTRRRRTIKGGSDGPPDLDMELMVNEIINDIYIKYVIQDLHVNYHVTLQKIREEIKKSLVAVRGIEDENIIKLNILNELKLLYPIIPSMLPGGSTPYSLEKKAKMMSQEERDKKNATTLKIYSLINNILEAKINNDVASLNFYVSKLEEALR